MERQPTVSVIIVNYNSGSLLSKVLRSLDRQSFKDFCVVIVDNASTDESLACIRSPYTFALEIIKSPENVGFAAANNLAARSQNTKYVLFLNPDAFPEDDFLENIVLVAERMLNYQLFSPLLMSADDPEIIDGLGDVYHYSGLVWRDGHGENASASPAHDVEIFSPCAAAALIRGSVFRELGGFDEDFFCYLEDVDLGFRARLLGYRSLLVHGVRVWHMGSAITGRNSDFSLYHGHRNLVWTFVKNMPGGLFWLLLPAHVALNIFSIIWFSLRGRGRIIMKAKIDALRGIPKMWRKRRELQHERRASALAIWRSVDKRVFRHKAGR